jgi:hypothetical protein
LDFTGNGRHPGGIQISNTTDVEQTMPSANAISVPSSTLSSRARSLGRALVDLPRRLFSRLLQRKRSRIPLLTEDLRRDVGLEEEREADREGAFWRQKLSSDGRDLPL